MQIQCLARRLLAVAAITLALAVRGEASTIINCPTTSTAIALSASGASHNSYAVPSGWSLALPYNFSLSDAEVLHSAGSSNDTLSCRYGVSEGNTTLHIYVSMGKTKPKNTCVLTANKKGFKCN